MWIEQKYFDLIKKSIPIPCVDLIVMNNEGQILMVKRNNEPAKGIWWFPGGRVYHGESRKTAAIRKLKDECGLKESNLMEMGTLEIFFDVKSEDYLSHGISTIFLVKTIENKVVLDSQSSEYSWKSIDEWKSIVSNDLLHQVLSNL